MINICCFGLIGSSFLVVSGPAVRKITFPLELLMGPFDISGWVGVFRDMESMLEFVLLLGKIILLPCTPCITDASIAFGCKSLKPTEEENFFGFVHSLLIFELNSVSYEEILFACLNVLISIVPAGDGMIAVNEGFSVSPLTSFMAPSQVPTPFRFNRWR